ncbi:hypothetical protein ACFLVD_01110, partial [Chloroflexota bacterium]
MTQKASPHKVSRMTALYLQGHCQTEIAGKLKVDQSTVSLYVGKLRLSAEQKGLKAAGEEFDVMNQVEALHSLAVELKKSQLTVEEAKVGLKIERLLRKYGIEQQDYKDLIEACTKMKSEGFVTSAVKLNQLENSTGMTYEEVVAGFESSHQQLGETQKNLQIVCDKLAALEDELTSIEKEKEAASQGLKAHMDQLGVDMARLKHIEDFAVALNKAKVSSKQLEEYIWRQHLLDETGVDLDTLAAILEQAKVLASNDHGKKLLHMLSKYGSLSQVLTALEAEVESLQKQADGLEQKAKLKGQFETEIMKLAAEKVSLEGCVSQL